MIKNIFNDCIQLRINHFKKKINDIHKAGCLVNCLDNIEDIYGLDHVDIVDTKLDKI